MAVDPGNAFHFLIPLALGLAGFHGVLFYRGPWKKTASWVLFQLGLVVFLLQLASKDNAFPMVLACATLAATVGVSVVLASFGLKWGGRVKVPEGGKTARRRSP